MPFDNIPTTTIADITHLGIVAHPWKHRSIYSRLPPQDDTLMVLIEARRMLEKPHAWIKGTAASPRIEAPGGIARCVGETVFDVAMRRQVQYAPAHQALLEAIPYEFADMVGRSIPGYNDALDTTFDMVLAWFDRAIDTERAKLEAT
jgi:hypothetical protein